jgi:hypothetical protein
VTPVQPQLLAVVLIVFRDIPRCPFAGAAATVPAFSFFCHHHLEPSDLAAPRSCRPWMYWRRHRCHLQGEKAVTIIVDASVRVSGFLQRLPRPRTCYVLAPGAGAGMTHPFMAVVAAGLAERGLATSRDGRKGDWTKLQLMNMDARFAQTHVVTTALPTPRARPYSTQVGRTSTHVGVCVGALSARVSAPA